MENKRLCSDCFILVRRQLVTLHENLVERNHVFNDTIYECQTCKHLIRLSHVPHQWSVMEPVEEEIHQDGAKTA